MPTFIPQHVWDGYKNRIYDLYFTRGLPFEEMRRIMKLEGLDATKATYYRKFRLWGDAPAKKGLLLQDVRLVGLVKQLYGENLKHSEILRVLKDFEGYPELQSWQLARIRKTLNLVYRRESVSPETIEHATNLIQEDLRSSLITQLGYRSVQTHLRVYHKMYLPRDTVATIMRTIDPIAVNSRGLNGPRRRKRYIVKGPNRIWSIDGHDKLSSYGFQIYGIMDAYSRKVLGFFVGLSNRCQISVLRYYMRAIREFGVPKAVRADKGKETQLLGAAHYAFRRKRKPETPIEKALAYGTSTKNQRIERFWRTLIDQQTEQWMLYFALLEQNGLFDGSKFDVIALTFLYMDQIRKQLSKYLTIYNSRAIRKQVSREFYLPAGKPNYMYKYPPAGVRNYASEPDPELYNSIEESMKWYDDQAYLIPRTREICEEIVQNSGIEYDLSDIKPGLDQPHVFVYQILRRQLFEHEEAGETVEELLRPEGGINTIEEQYANFQGMMNIEEYETPGNLAGEVEVLNNNETDSEEESERESIDGDEDFFELDNCFI